jgi:hypothetical protein
VSIEEGILGDQLWVIRVEDIVHWDVTTPDNDEPRFVAAAAAHIDDPATPRPLYVLSEDGVPTTHLRGEVMAIWAVAREPWWPGSDVGVVVTRAQEARGSGTEVASFLFEIA